MVEIKNETWPVYRKITYVDSASAASRHSTVPHIRPRLLYYILYTLVH